MKRITIYCALLLILFSALATAQVSQTAVPFLLIAPGARAGGMGETFVAIADDATATHWNPAGLGRYPLSPNWLELPVQRNQSIKTITLLKNDIPEMNYKQYDIWAIIDGHLAEWVPGKSTEPRRKISPNGLYTPAEMLSSSNSYATGGYWRKGISRNFNDLKSLTSTVAHFAGVEDDQAGPFVKIITELSTGIKIDMIDSIQRIVESIMPSDYSKKADIDSEFVKLKFSWSVLRVDLVGFSKLNQFLQSATADSHLTTSELDSLFPYINKTIKSTTPFRAYIPYNVVLKSLINCLESHDGMIYAGTDSGFYRFDPKLNKWKSYGIADSLPSLKITALEKMGRKSILIGTDKGIVYYNGAKIKSYTPEQNAPAGNITAISALSDQDIWAATDQDIYHYDGAVWKNYQQTEIHIGEDLDKLAGKFYKSVALINKTKLQKDILTFNGIDSLPAVGQKIKMPYKPAVKGAITCIAAKDKALWIGTQNGVILFNGESFFHYGYREYKTDKPVAAIDVAKKFLPDGDQARVERLANMIRDYNGLTGDSIAESSSVMVYANALGSQIYTIAAPSEKAAYVGTAYGVVQYDDGGWSRFSRLEFVKSPVHTIKTESGELWFAAQNNVYILAKAKGQATFMHSNYLVQLANDLYYDYFAIVYPTSEWGTFGSGLTFLSYGQQDRTNEVGDVVGQFTSYDFAWTVSYGTKLSKNLSAGLSGRIIISHLADVGAGLEKGKGVGFSGAVDGGIIYDIDPKTTLGVTVTNIGPEIAYIDADQADPLPRKLAIAVAYKLIDSPYNKLTIVGEANKLLVGLNGRLKTEIQEIIPHIGAEYWYSNYFALRAGYVYDKVGVQKYLTLGGSLQYTRLRIDLSYIPSSSEATNRLGNTIRISLNVGF